MAEAAQEIAAAAADAAPSVDGSGKSARDTHNLVRPCNLVKHQNDLVWVLLAHVLMAAHTSNDILCVRQCGPKPVLLLPLCCRLSR